MRQVKEPYACRQAGMASVAMFSDITTIKNNSYEVHGQITCDVPARSGGHRGIAPIRGVR